MNYEIVDRYVYAVVKYLPHRFREEIEKELKGAILDTVETKYPDREPDESEIKEIIMEFGEPRDLARQYLPEGHDSLIGFPYLYHYYLMLKIVGSCLLIGSVVSFLVSQVAGSESLWYIDFGDMIGSMISGAAGAFTFITILFALLQRNNQKVFQNDEIDHLPPLPNRKHRYKKSDAVTGICFSVVFTVILFAAPRLFSIPVLVSGSPKTWIPLFNIENIAQMRWIVLALCALSILQESYGLYQGVYNIKVAVLQCVTHVFSIVLSGVFLLTRSNWNPDFADTLFALMDKDLDSLRPFLDNIRVIFFCVYTIVVLITIISNFYKAFGYQKHEASVE